uniref:Uncharacterized protein n=1 Tax=Opuntia streptacantha TaxID=393608 RepID=A0A7C9D7P2_OPUST
MWPNSSSPSFPTKATLPPSLETAMATFAGAPPGALRKPGASARETPETVGTKSISISPKLTTRPRSLLQLGTPPSLVAAIVEYRENELRFESGERERGDL